MTDFGTARFNMVVSQVRTDNVTDPRLQEAMATLPREEFVPQAVRGRAYSSEAVPLGGGRALMAPRSFAKLAHALRVREGDVVLVVGAGTGYGAAVLSRLALAVVAVEEDDGLAAQASALFVAHGIDNGAVVKGPLTAGCPAQGPYDIIMLDGAAETIPPVLFEQLKSRGRLGAILIDGPVGKARIYTKIGDSVSGRSVCDAMAPILPGFAKERAFSL